MSAVKIRLFFPCEIAVKGVTHFVRQCKHAVDGVVMVQEHIGVYAVAAPGICAAAFAFVFVNVNPACVHAIMESVGVFFAHDSKGFFYGFFCFFESDFCVHILHQGCVQIVHVDFVQPQQFFSEGNITMHQMQIGMDGFDEVIINRKRNIVII